MWTRRVCGDGSDKRFGRIRRTLETVSRPVVADALRRLSTEHPGVDVSLRESHETGHLLVERPLLRAM
jgi:hypothetical protein